MCDTFVVMPSHTESGNLVFGKNADREPNEAQVIERIPAREPTEEWLQCTYLKIPQVRKTYELILSRPFQMWGAEMGVNQHGVVIGNEAVFTKIVMPRRNSGLTGMDLLRLALERTRSAQAALDCIIELLERYGQNASGGYQNQHFYYHNSFLIADATQAWILETAGRHWVAQQVSGYASISNGLCIGESYDRISENAVDYAYHRHWLADDEAFDFQKAYSDWLMSRMSSCRFRQRFTENQLRESSPEFTVPLAISVLQSHEQPDHLFKPYKASTASICMHATGLTNPNQTTGSMLAEIRIEGPHTVWLTGTSMPCLSIYKPFFFETTSIMGKDWVRPGSKEDGTLWWKAETVHRNICKDYQKGKSLIQNERVALQQNLLQEEATLIRKNAGSKQLNRLSQKAITSHERLLDQWSIQLDQTGLKNRSRNPLYWLYQYRKDINAGLK